MRNINKGTKASVILKVVISTCTLIVCCCL